MEVSGQLYAPASLPPPPRNQPQYPIEHGAGLDPEPVRAILENRKTSCPDRSSNLGPSIPREILI